MIKKIGYIILFFQFLRSNIVKAQKIQLAPYYGRSFFSAGANDIIEAKFDSSYSNTAKSSKYMVGISVLYSKNKSSYELLFTSQLSVYRFYSYYSQIGSLEYLVETKFSQFQFLYNYHFLNLKTDSKNFQICPIVSLGLGIGQVQKQSKLDNEKFYSLDYSPNGEKREVLLSTKQNAKVSFSAIPRVGFSLYKNGKNVLRLFASYNIGLNNSLINNVNYSYGANMYYSKTKTKGSYFSFNLSCPIVVKNFSKK